MALSNLNAYAKKVFVKDHEDSFAEITERGFDCQAAIAMEEILKRAYKYSEHTPRRVLLVSFVKIYIQNKGKSVNEPKKTYVPVTKEIPVVIPKEAVLNREYMESQIWEFIEHKNHIINKQP